MHSDLTQFSIWLVATNATVSSPSDVTRADVVEFLADLGRREVTGVSRARKLAAIRELFRHLAGEGAVTKIPTTGVATPKRERPGRAFLRSDEYSRMLSLAGGHPRDFAILQVFLQTGVRVSELCDLRLVDVDLREGSLVVASGKGGVGRTVELEKKGIQGLRTWLTVRPNATSDRLFLNYAGEPLSERGVRKLVVKYRDAAWITKKASCHSLRHTFATHKAEAGVSPFQLKEWRARQSGDHPDLRPPGTQERPQGHGGDQPVMTRTATRRRHTYVVQNRQVVPLDQIVLRSASTLPDPLPRLPGYPTAALLIVSGDCPRTTERAIWLIARQFRRPARGIRLLDR